MPPHPPAILIPLLDQPIVAQHLGVEVKDLVRGVVDVVPGPGVEEEAVMVDELAAAVQVQEGGHVGAVGPVQQVRGREVEVGGPEVEGAGEVGDAAAEVAEFVDFGGAWWEKGGGLVIGFRRGRMFADLFSYVGICCLGGAFLLAVRRYRRSVTSVSTFCKCPRYG